MKSKCVLACGVLAISFLLGCNAPGWEPGPVSDQSSTIPIPGLGNTEFGGERDTTFILSGMRGVPGSQYPDIDNITLTRSASGPLATRGGQQQAVELLRWQEARETQRLWQTFAMQALTAASPYMATWQQRQEAAASAAPSARDQAIATALEKLAAKLDAVIERGQTPAAPAASK